MSPEGKIDPQSLIRHEIIGLNCKIRNSSDPNKTNIEGKIVWETKNMIHVKTAEGVKKLPKKEIAIDFELPDEKVVRLKGELIKERPQDRIKKLN